ncbi:HAMP domain-containing protein [Lysobacter sp. TY2-98]|uniref:ATP-binding protein n=1 Tax=Lysobacter sp. TY2-98 TaxID=2290922 RepID=UPI000E203FFC|nr:ATP-binding protein [Lysobacter sp. TY2-98]AXK72162.1 HAMP domain-containing protein [Lysobacter sp. TY2-98]
MVVPLRVRLFVIGVASMLLVGIIGLALIRWSFAGGARQPLDYETDEVNAIVAVLSATFDAAGGWKALPATSAARDAWWRATIARAVETSPTPPGRATSTLADRAALTDASGRLLAGTQPGAPLVMLASIDRRTWTIPSRHGIAGHLTVALPRNPDDALTIAVLMQKQRHLTVLALIGIALSALAAGMVATSLRRPIHALLEGARRLGRSEFDTQIDARRRDEFGQLARSFNELGARLKANAGSRRQWIADTSHELRTPLAVLKAQLEAMQDGIRPLSQASLASMEAQIASLQSLVGDLDQLSRGDTGALHLEREPLDPWTIAKTTWDDFAERMRERGLDARIVPPTSPAVAVADPARLRQVIRNLVENSARYTATGGSVTMTGDVEASHFRLHIDDSAPGVPATDLPRLGERFFRVDASRSREHGGSGLGLALARQIVEAHGGRLEFSASPLGGLRATLSLPLVPT